MNIQTLSLSLSLSHTHTRTHTHCLSLSLSLSHTHTHSLSLSHSLSHTHTPQAENVLYGDTEAAQDLRHKTLTEEDYRKHYKGSLSPGPADLGKEGAEPVGGACRRLLLVMIVVILVLLLLVALAAGVLALAILFTGFVDTAVCDCPGQSKL